MPRSAPLIQAPPLLLARDQAAAALGISVSSLEQLSRLGELPPPRRISAGRTGWLWRELQEWAEARPISDLAPGPGKRAAAPDAQPAG